MEKLWLKPHTFDPDALIATENTIKALVRGGGIWRDSTGEIDRRGDWLRFEVVDPYFVGWAALAQGYVLAACVGEDPINEC